MDDKWLRIANNLKQDMIDLRRDFHRHPELEFAEHRTAGIVAEHLKRLGMQVTTGVAETGVVGLLRGKESGRVVMLRFDMDALPIQEENECDYRSQTPGVMHACGHDGHTAIGITVARMLAENIRDIHGTVKFIFQPAEEGSKGEKGAPSMVAEGVLENPKPEVVLGLHLWNYKPLGWIGITPRPMMAASDVFSIVIQGKGGHAAAPHENRDTILTACEIVSAIQTITSRNVPSVETAVIGVSMFHGGDAPNVTPSEVTLKGVIRTFTPEVRNRVLQRLETLVREISSAYECQGELKIIGSIPPVVNDPAVASGIQAVAKSLLPDHNVDGDYVTMISEDYGVYLQNIPGCFILFGSSNPAKDLAAPHHNPKFDFDEDALPQAAALMAAGAEYFINL